MLQIIPSQPLPLFHATASASASSSKQPHHADSDDEMETEEPEAGPSKFITSPGEVITSSREFMRGHGTYIDYEGAAASEALDHAGDGVAGNVISTVAGTVERVNKLVSVKPAHFR